MHGMEHRSLERQIRDLAAEQASPPMTGGWSLARLELDLRKWDLIHRHLRRNPFRVRRTIPRSQQWGQALDRVRNRDGAD